MVELSVDTQLRMIAEGAVQLTPIDELRKKLERGRPLRVKLGFDPTAPDIHFGHVVVLNKLRQLQDIGHHVTLLIGDFTAAIGDPSGRNTTRPQLPRSVIEANAQTYVEQACKVLDRSKLTIVNNSTWGNALTSADMISIASRFTVARMMERTDFANRYANHESICIHEFLYPLMQGYDSVVLDADLEIGGTDQTFNLMVGRHLQQEFSKEPQCILTMPLLVGLDGTMKMSKSKDNYIGVTEDPDTMFSKVMSISDHLMWDWIPLLTVNTNEDVLVFKHNVAVGIETAMGVKVKLAQGMVDKFHGYGVGKQAYDRFIHRSKGGIPDVIREVILPFDDQRPIGLVVKLAGLTPSVSEANRKISQRGIRIDQVVLEDPKMVLGKGTYVIALGKRDFVRVTIS